MYDLLQTLNYDIVDVQKQQVHKGNDKTKEGGQPGEGKEKKGECKKVKDDSMSVKVELKPLETNNKMKAVHKYVKRTIIK